MSRHETWLRNQIWPSLDSISLKCPRPIAGSHGFHWWYNDGDEMERIEESGKEQEYVPIICKSCGLQLKLSNDAPEFPSI